MTAYKKLVFIRGLVKAMNVLCKPGCKIVHSDEELEYIRVIVGMITKLKGGK